MNNLYNHTGMRSKKDNIFAALFITGFKDRMIQHDKMTYFKNLSVMAGVLLKRMET